MNVLEIYGVTLHMDHCFSVSQLIQADQHEDVFVTSLKPQLARHTADASQHRPLSDLVRSHVLDGSAPLICCLDVSVLHVRSATGIQRFFFSCQQPLLWFTGVPVCYRLHDGLGTKKFHKTTPALCRTPCHVFVRVSICSHINFIIYHQLRSESICSVAPPKTALRSLWPCALSQDRCFASARQHTCNFHRRRCLVTLQAKSTNEVQHLLNHILVSRSYAPCHQAQAGLFTESVTAMVTTFR